jgi:hypothetical protein
MKTRQVGKTIGAKLPSPPTQREDLVKGVGWSYGPAFRRTRQQAEAEIAPLLITEGEPSGLPPDPPEPPPLPEPPPQQPDTDQRGGQPGGEGR